jgi:hypothetical protein
VAKRRLREGLSARLAPADVWGLREELLLALWRLREELLLARLARDAQTMVDPAAVGLLRVTHHTLANQLRTAAPALQQDARAHWLAGLATMTAQEASEAGIQGLRSWRQHFSLPGAGVAPKPWVGWQRLPPNIQRGVRCLPVSAPGTARCPLLVYASSREGAAGFRLDSCQAPEKLSQATAALLVDAFDARARDGGAAAATAMIGDGTAQGLARSVFGDAVQRLVADASADEEDEEAAAIASWATTAAPPAAAFIHLFFTVAKSGLFIDPGDRNMVYVDLPMSRFCFWSFRVNSCVRERVSSEN